MRKTKKMVLLSLFTAIAIVIYAIEAQLPTPIAIPGVKLGLSNMVSLSTLLILGPIECITVLILRIILGSFITGSISALLFSLAGGLLSNIGMILLYVLFNKHISLWVISMIGSILHNIGQLFIAAIIIENLKIYYYLPILLVSAIITGYFVGIGAYFIQKQFKSINTNG